MCPRCFRLRRAEFEGLDDRIDWPAEGRFRDRVWPVFCRLRPKRQKKLPLSWHPCHEKLERSMEKAIRLEIFRRWLPSYPLMVQWDRVDERCDYREPWHWDAFNLCAAMSWAFLAICSACFENKTAPYPHLRAISAYRP